SLSVRRSSCPLGSHAWILIAMFHLAMDLASCQPPASGAGGRLSPRPALRHRLSRGLLWGAGSGEELRRPGPPWTCTPACRVPPHVPPVPCPCSSLCVAGKGLAPGSLVMLGVPGGHWGARGGGASAQAAALTSMSRMCARTAAGTGRAVVAGSLPRPAAGQAGSRLPTSFPGLQPGQPCGHPQLWPSCGPCPETSLPVGSQPGARLAVHQIITITVSLIMVIAALITTLVLKNCCAQSGRPRRNSHQRKLDQQEESCQNLTDFAPARVPSTLDIFTAYNETLQCSHECVRTPVPVYAEETLHSPGDYKTTFNGNRPSSSDRHLIPVAFVSEKWFEISC
ncbi:AJAP1 protein, partial [Thalassarche chlororhynchos]|nr:AJAP1 protein [Thalassarche chlororhynchos]